MPSELNVQAIAGVTSGAENPAEPQAESFVSPAQAPSVQSASPMPNPQLRLDPALGLVVIEFRDASGTVTTSIPSQRQLNAYRMWDQMGLAPEGQSASPQPPALPMENEEA